MANKERTEARLEKEKNLVAKNRELARNKLIELFSNDSEITLKNYLRFPVPVEKKEFLGEKRFVAGLEKEEAEKLADKVLRTKELMTKYPDTSSALDSVGIIPVSPTKQKKISCGIKDGKILVAPCKKEKYASRFKTSGIVGVSVGDYIPSIEKIVKPYGLAMKKLLRTDKTLGTDSLKITSAYPTKSEIQNFALKAKAAENKQR